MPRTPGARDRTPRRRRPSGNSPGPDESLRQEDPNNSLISEDNSERPSIIAEGEFYYFCSTCGERWPRDQQYVFDYGRHCRSYGHIPGGVCDAEGNIIEPYQGKMLKQAKDKPGKPGTAPTRIGDVESAQFLDFYSVTSRIPYTPIMRQARRASVEQWGWPANMTFDHFIDIILETFFGDRGIILGAYAVEKEEALWGS